MNSEKYVKIIENRVKGFKSPTLDLSLLSNYKQLIKDDKYVDFISECNGGFFFNGALHIYGYSNQYDFHDVNYINQILQEEYGAIVKGLLSFGQDIFGNQFAFDLLGKEVVFLNIETGEKEILSKEFASWLDVLLNQMDYFTGYKLASAWHADNQLGFNQRLCPKMPFILGGNYTLGNLYAGTFPDFIKAAANIARQVYNLPEGTNFKITIKHQ
jgi:hypothetical protein